MKSFHICTVLCVLITVSVLEFSRNVNALPRCNKTVDIAFVIDISSSIWDKHFNQEISFIHDVVNLLDVGDSPNQSRVAAVSYSNHLNPQFGFSQYNTKEDVLSAINQIAHEAGDATRTYLGLEYVHQTIFAPGNGERDNVENVVVVLTDGVTNPAKYDEITRSEAKQLTKAIAQTLRDKLKAQVFAIGIGNDVDRNEIRAIANKPSDVFTLFVDTFAELDTDALKTTMLTKVCAPPPQKDRECLTSKADIFFVVDESSSLEYEYNFQKELRFVASLIGKFDVGIDSVRVGMMTFGNNPRMLFHLNEFKTKDQIFNTLKYIPWLGGNTNLDMALDILMTSGLNPSFGSRFGVPQIAVVITDGKSSRPEETEKQIAKMRGLNYEVLAIGVGPLRDQEELEKIASNPDHVFQVENLDGLTSIRKRILDEFCPKPTLPPLIDCQGSRADLIFVADSSTSIGITAYNKLKSFATSVVEKFNIGPNSIQIGLITFSDDAYYDFDLNEYKTKGEIVAAIKEIPYLGGDTYTNKALEILIRQGYSSYNGGRGDTVPRFAVIITDGASRQPILTKKLAEKAKDIGIVIFSIGVGPYIDQTELNAMASSPTSMHSFMVDNYAALASIEQSLVDRTCQEAIRRQFP